MTMSKALKAAIEANNPEAVRKALKGVKDVNRRIPGANTPLLYACEKGADKVLEVLFESGAIAVRRRQAQRHELVQCLSDRCSAAAAIRGLEENRGFRSGTR